jgi:glutathione S-transferase
MIPRRRSHAIHRLYYSPGACSLAVHIVLEEIGAPYELELRSARNGEGTTTPDYLAINPKGRVPTLTGVDGGAVLTEATAILLFLARRHPQALLLPDGIAGEARVLEWLSWLSIDLHGIGYGQLWRAHRFVDDPSLETAVQAKGRANIAAAHDLIEQRLCDGRPWAVGDRYSLVDPYLLVFWLWGSRVDFDMARWPSWSRLMERVLDRSAVRRAMAQEGLV